PRKHRRHLRRRRIRRRYAGRGKGSRFSKERISAAIRENSLRDETESGGVLEKSWRTGKGRRLRRNRNQPSESIRHCPLGAQRDLICDSEPPKERNAGPQGQHYEVHRRRVPRLGL